MDDGRPWTWPVDDPRFHHGEPAEQTPDLTIEELEAELREFMASRPDLYPPR